MKSIKLLETLLNLKENENLSPRSIIDANYLIKKLDNNIKKTETNIFKKNKLKKQNEINKKLQENNQNNITKQESKKIFFEDMDKYPLITDSDLS